jgi:hypothetical protein
VVVHAEGVAGDEGRHAVGGLRKPGDGLSELHGAGEGDVAGGRGAQQAAVVDVEAALLAR